MDLDARFLVTMCHASLARMAADKSYVCPKGTSFQEAPAIYEPIEWFTNTFSVPSFGWAAWATAAAV